MANLPSTTPDPADHSHNPGQQIAVLAANIEGLNGRMDQFFTRQDTLLTTLGTQGTRIAVLESVTENCPMKSGNPSPIIDFEARIRVLEQFMKQAGKKWSRWENLIYAIVQGLILGALILRQGGP